MSTIIFLTTLLAIWQNPTPVYVGLGDQTIDVVISDGEGGAAVIWWDDVTEWNYMQVIDSAGNLKWDAEGVPIIATAGLSTQNPDVFQDNEGNYWVALEGNEDIYVQKLSPSGQRLFGDDGVAVCTAEGEQSVPKLCSSAEGAIVVWKDFREILDPYPYTQRLTQNGTIAWEANGLRITESLYGTIANCVSDLYGGALFIFRRWFEEENYTAGQRIDSLGNRLWGDSGIVYAPGNLGNEKGSINGYIVEDGEGGFVFFYDNEGYYKANRVDSLGTLLWDAGGIIVGEDNYWHFGSVSSLSTSGLYVVRGETETSELIYAHRLTLSGETPWGDSGKVLVWEALSGEPHGDIIPSATKDGIIVWRDVYDELGWYEQQGVLAQRVDMSGNILWSNEVIVTGTEGNSPLTTSTYDKGAIIVWQTGDVYAAKIDSLGNISGVEEQPYPAAEPLLQVWEPYPNPMISIANIRFTLDESSTVNVTVFDVSGRRVVQVIDDWFSAGEHIVQWNGTSQGSGVAAGAYFIKVSTDKVSETVKLIIIN